uniref:IRF-like-4 interferon regulatory factor like protein n=1 Tax=Phallusia mammillata TaxID=59560 RepID=A0A6F9DFZ3_9ASCI|nr:IRF-like-4 interferon regulatory factor like protein [Phallusia mammillata]
MREGYNNFEPHTERQPAVMTSTAAVANGFDSGYRQPITASESYHVQLQQAETSVAYNFSNASRAMRNGEYVNGASPGQQHSPASPASSTTSSGSGTATRTEPPKRLRYWLIDMIESGTIPGLQWENPDRTVFRIPWKHAGKNNWREEDCRIFKEWAKHRGKWKPGDKLDAATWKTRLRCALNKLPDIKELKEHSNLEGNDPFRVYQLLPEPDKSQEAEIWPRKSWSKESPPPNHHGNHHVDRTYPRRESYDHVMVPVIRPNIPHEAVVTSEPQRPLTADPTHAFSRMKVEDSSPGEYCHVDRHVLDVAPPPAYPENDQSQLRTRHTSNESAPFADRRHSGQQQEIKSQLDGAAFQNGCDVTSTTNMDADGFKSFQSGIDQSLLADFGSPPLPHEMEIYIRYRGSNVMACHVTEPKGCRVHYGDASLQHIASATHQLPSAVFGSVSLRQIELVDCEQYAQSSKQVQLTRHILNNVRRGLIFYYENGCFFANRLCQSRVFLLGPESPDTGPERLDRNVPLKVFDYRKFCYNLKRYAAEGRLKPPETEIQVSFGQNWSIKTPIEKNLVTLYMVPRAARYLLLKIRERHQQFVSLNDSILSSGPDSYDQLAERATSASVQCVDELMRVLNEGGQGGSLIDLIGPLQEATPAVNSQPQVTPYQTGYFQQNILHPAPITPFNDVEMETNGN